MAEQGRIPPQLRLCRGCRRFVVPGPADCPFCGGDMDSLAAEHERLEEEVQRAADALRAAMEEARARQAG